MYRTIDARFWTDPKVRKLSSNAKLLFVYLITNPHTHPSGIYYVLESTIAEEVGLPKNQVRIALDTLSGANLARFDRENSLVWVKNMLRYQCKGGKLIRSAAIQLCSCHNSFLVQEFINCYPDIDKVLSPTERDTLSGANLACHSEQEQEQEQEQERARAAAAAVFQKPSLEEVESYCRERGGKVEARRWYDHYEANGWLVGRAKMKDWKAAVRTWETNNVEKNGHGNGHGNGKRLTPQEVAAMVSARTQGAL